MYTLIFSADLEGDSALQKHKRNEMVGYALDYMGLKWQGAQGSFRGVLEGSFIVRELTEELVSKLRERVIAILEQECVLVISPDNQCWFEDAKDSTFAGMLRITDEEPEGDYTYDPRERVFYSIMEGLNSIGEATDA